MHALLLKGWSPLLPPLWSRRTATSWGVATICMRYSMKIENASWMALLWGSNGEQINNTWVEFPLNYAWTEWFKQFAKLARGFLKPKLLVYWARLGDDRLGGHACGLGLEWYAFDLGARSLGLDPVGSAGWRVCGGCVAGVWWVCAAGSGGVDEGEGVLHIALCHGLFQLVCYWEGFDGWNYESLIEPRSWWNTASLAYKPDETTSSRGSSSNWMWEWRLLGDLLLKLRRG